MLSGFPPAHQDDINSDGGSLLISRDGLLVGQQLKVLHGFISSPRLDRLITLKDFSVINAGVTEPLQHDFWSYVPSFSCLFLSACSR